MLTLLSLKNIFTAGIIKSVVITHGRFIFKKLGFCFWTSSRVIMHSLD